jgi:acetoin utilization protein AcuB
MKVSEIMSRSVQRVSAAMAAREAWQLMQRKRCHHLVVMHDSEIVGVLSDRVVGGPNGARLRARASVSDLMTMDVVTIPPGAPVSRAANLMRGRSIGCLPVVDGERVVGIVTLSDLIELIGQGAPAAKTRHRNLPHRRTNTARTARRSVKGRRTVA